MHHLISSTRQMYWVSFELQFVSFYCSDLGTCLDFFIQEERMEVVDGSNGFEYQSRIQCVTLSFDTLSWAVLVLLPKD